MAARYDFRGQAVGLCCGAQYINAKGNRDIGADAKPDVVRLQIEALIHRRRQADDYFGAGHRQAFPGADVDGNPFPTTGIDLQPQRGKVSTCESAATPCSWR